jgi:Leucine-rich repeat (LRR) protein
MRTIIPSYDVEKIELAHYTDKTKKIILSNLKNYTKLKRFDCNWCNLTKLPDLPNSLEDLFCHTNKLTKLPYLPNSLKTLWCNYNKLTKLPNLPNSLKTLWCYRNNLTELPDLPDTLIELDCDKNNLDLIYSNQEIKTINETNSKNRIIKRTKLLNRTLLLEHSAVITMNPKRIERLLDNLEIDFYDGSFDTLTF